LISQHGLCTQLYLITLFIRINFLLYQMIIEIDTHMKVIEIKSKKTKYYARLHISGKTMLSFYVKNQVKTK